MSFFLWAKPSGVRSQWNEFAPRWLLWDLNVRTCTCKPEQQMPTVGALTKKIIYVILGANVSESLAQRKAAAHCRSVKGWNGCARTRTSGNSGRSTH